MVHTNGIRVLIGAQQNVYLQEMSRSVMDTQLSVLICRESLLLKIDRTALSIWIVREICVLHTVSTRLWGAKFIVTLNPNKWAPRLQTWVDCSYGASLW